MNAITDSQGAKAMIGIWEVVWDVPNDASRKFPSR
jgi:hypothetical protein